MKRFTAVVAVVMTASGILQSASPAYGTYPGKNGRIAFRKILTPGFDRGEDYTWAAIFTIRPDGTGLRRITHPPNGVVTTQPDWSPNGRWIAYMRKKLGSDWRVFRIRRNGTDRENLSQACVPDRCIAELNPAWSPTGRRIVYVRAWTPERRSELHVNLFVMRPNGTHRVAVTSGPTSRHEDYGPQWSPNGKRLVFERFNATRRKSAAFTVRLDGSGLRRLTPWRMDAGGLPDWSPNGRWIMFFNHLESDVPKTLWLVHPNGEGLHRITTTSGGTFTWWSGSFSPDGSMITAGGSPWEGRADVYLMNYKGEGLQSIAETVRWDSEPDWGPRLK
jgi:Tol biopolymer transport system component